MNAERRKRIGKLIGRTESLKEDLQIVKDEENDVYNRLLEPLQEGEKGCKIYERIEKLDNALAYLDDVLDCLYEARQD